MVKKAWVATHTGLPSIYTTEAGPVYAGERLLAVFPAGGGTVSDPLAPLGQPVEYRQGDWRQTVTRPTGAAREAVLSGLDGRRAPGVWLRDNKDPLELSPKVRVAANRRAVWRKDPAPRTGKLLLTLWDADREADLWALLRSPSPVVVATPRPIPGVDAVRVLVVTNVQRLRVSPWGMQEFALTWVEYQGSVPAAPVLTWGEYEALHGVWQAGTSLDDLLREIAGMP